MHFIDRPTRTGRVVGRLADGFEAVLDEFVRNFDERGEVGASLSFSVEGETIADLWGGHVDRDRTVEWDADTVSVVFSVTKAATALCAHLLAERGELDLDRKVVDYWPEFGRHGKEATTVAMLLTHTAGVPAFRDPVPTGMFYDWEQVVARLEDEPPFWEPGTRSGYHMVTFGWTVGEVVRRVSGRSLGTYFADEFATPLGLDFWIGLPEAVEPRVSPVFAHDPGPDIPLTDFTTAILDDRNSIPALALLNTGGANLGNPKTREQFAAEIGGAGGIGNARALARLFTPLANGGGDLFTSDSITTMSQVAAASLRDATLAMPTRFGSGFMRSMDNRRRPFGHIESCLIGTQAFGHVGAGGSIGFADPECRLGFAYSMNQMGPGLLLNPRGQSLVDAVYRSLGYRTDRPGAWVR
jgi:CubicO group peptidase (beta-lactamase class C family)